MLEHLMSAVKPPEGLQNRIEHIEQDGEFTAGGSTVEYE